MPLTNLLVILNCPTVTAFNTSRRLLALFEMACEELRGDAYQEINYKMLCAMEHA